MTTISVRTYDHRSDAPQPLGPVGLEVPDGASDEQIIEQIRREWVDPSRPADIKWSDGGSSSLFAINRGWAVIYLDRPLTYDHPRWSEFAEGVATSLIGTECDGSHIYTRVALRAIEADEDASIKWLENEGGHCDCEVALNVVFARATKEDS